MPRWIISSVALLFCLGGFAFAQELPLRHAIAMSGAPKYSADFTHFDYANPDAPKGGTLHQSAIGTYDSFHPFIPKGVAAEDIGLIYDTLLVNSQDEPFTEYGLLARHIQMPEDRSYIIFHLDPQARFHDGEPVKPADVIFTFNALMEQGDPFYKKYYQDVQQVTDLGDGKVRFDFGDSTNQELPLIVGQLPVLPAHYWADKDFGSSTLEPPLGSGPYRVARFEAGKTVTYERVADYWGQDVPAQRGHYNFDRIQIDYYRDATVALEAFNAGEYNFREENNSKDWATMYTGDKYAQGLIVKEEIAHELPRGMQGFAYNTRRAMFQDRRVREALGYAFDFEWSNQNLFYGQYRRSKSFYTNSELAASGLPSDAELRYLEPLRDQLPPEVFTQAFQVPVTDGSGNLRRQLRQASQLLTQAGWTVVDGKRVNAQGEPLAFEILLISPAFERIVLPFKKNLERLGVEASVRVVDASQYVNRLRSFDFDMIVAPIGQSLSPGNEQREFWHSESADLNGSRNWMGIRNPAIDQLVENVIAAPNRAELIVRTRALDRALLWNHYVIPHWHINYFRIAYWNRFARPAVSPKYGLGLFTWWEDAAKAQAIDTQGQ
jgi:microcin C transport system substrate-binding protein